MKNVLITCNFVSPFFVFSVTFVPLRGTVVCRLQCGLCFMGRIVGMSSVTRRVCTCSFFFIILLGHPGCVCVVWVKECNAVQINSLVLDGQNNVSLYVAAGVSVSFI